MSPREQLPPSAMAARKRRAGRDEPAENSPQKSPRRRRKLDGDGQPASTQQKKRKVVWRMLPLDIGEPSTINFDIDGPEGEVDGVDHEENTFTAHCDATVRASAMADWVQQGASAEGHIDDVVAVNDTFTAKVDEELEKMDLSVVQELEAGSVPEDVLTAPVSSLFRQKEGQLHGSAESQI
jgi:hypothetical protein